MTEIGNDEIYAGVDMIQRKYLIDPNSYIGSLKSWSFKLTEFVIFMIFCDLYPGTS